MAEEKKTLGQQDHAPGWFLCTSKIWYEQLTDYIILSGADLDGNEGVLNSTLIRFLVEIHGQKEKWFENAGATPAASAAGWRAEGLELGRACVPLGRGPCSAASGGICRLSLP